MPLPTLPNPNNDVSPVSGYTMGVVHTGYDYKIYGRDLNSEISTTLDAYLANASKWASTNLTLTGSLVSQTVTNAASLKPIYSSSMGSSAITLVPTTAGQVSRMDELALAAKALIESPEIDESANAQIAAGLSAAMGGGHNAATAIKDNITFEQKISAKQVAFAAYAQALDAYYKTYTATGSQLSQATADGAARAALTVPTVAPFESQLAADILSNWQDTLNTGQLRDQQIRQTYEAGTALDNFNPGTNYQAWNAEYALAYCGIKSQAAAAKTT